MAELEWKDPQRPVRRVDRVAAALQANPRRWARIEADAPGIVLMAWWHPLNNTPGYEVKSVPTGEAASPFGPRDIYARYVGSKDADPDQEP